MCSKVFCQHQFRSYPSKRLLPVVSLPFLTLSLKSCMIAEFMLEFRSCSGDRPRGMNVTGRLTLSHVHPLTCSRRSSSPWGLSVFARSALGTCSRPCSLKVLRRDSLASKRPPSLTSSCWCTPSPFPALLSLLRPLARTTPLPYANASVEIKEVTATWSNLCDIGKEDSNIGLKTCHPLIIFQF